MRVRNHQSTDRIVIPYVSLSGNLSGKVVVPHAIHSFKLQYCYVSGLFRIKIVCFFTAHPAMSGNHSAQGILIM